MPGEHNTYRGLGSQTLLLAFSITWVADLYARRKPLNRVRLDLCQLDLLLACPTATTELAYKRLQTNRLSLQKPLVATVLD